MVDQKNIDKRMEAKNVVQLKHMLVMELNQVKEENDIDIVMFMGVDGRVFSSIIPPILDAPQFKLLNLVKSNMVHICRQLDAENMKSSIQEYSFGTVIITGVGDNAFLASLFVNPPTSDELGKVTSNLVRGSRVMNHLFQLRPITDEYMEGYDKDVVDELKGLTRRLFVEKFDETREYKRNMEILEYLKKKIGSVVGIGAIDEVVTLTMNELGARAAYMKGRQWVTFTEMAINNHIRKSSGDMVADECLKNWIPEVERMLKSFV